ncbi:hypothetical protein D3C85_1265650 [compost metagenome]
MAGDVLGRTDSLEEFFGDDRGLLGVADVGEDHHEFVRTVAEHRVGLTHRGHQIAPDLLEHLVTGRMAQCVVDAFEAVEPQKHHRQLFVIAPGQRQ